MLETSKVTVTSPSDSYYSQVISRWSKPLYKEDWTCN